MGPAASKWMKSLDSRKILMLGLDSAGKTTILYKLKLNEGVQTIPTIGFNVEELKIGKNLTFTIWDVGGQEKIRPLWRYYFSNCSALVFVIDSNDEERISEAKKEMFSIMNSDEMKGVRILVCICNIIRAIQVPLIVLANKQDLPNSLSSAQLVERLKLKKLESCHKWHLQACCAVTGEGLFEAMKHVGRLSTDYLKSQKKILV